ncbi:MAG: hypothetical protein FJX76_00555 [Armatimonadetes bacterium]|nr:hypothetical protein [Armatimonadota bacterium]
MRHFLLVIAFLLSCAGYAHAAAQVLPGRDIGAAAERFVATSVGISQGEVRSVYNVPDHSVPVGGLELKPRWQRGMNPPAAGFRGRVNVPVTILVGKKIIQEIPVLVEVASPGPGPGMTGGPGAATTAAVGVRGGDPVTVTLLGSGMKLQMSGVAQQPGKIGERVRVQVKDPYRVIMARVVSDREVTIEP